MGMGQECSRTLSDLLYDPSNRVIGPQLSSMAAPTIPSQVDILKTDAAAKKGLGVKAKDTEAIWPKPQFVSFIAVPLRPVI